MKDLLLSYDTGMFFIPEVCWKMFDLLGLVRDFSVLVSYFIAFYKVCL